MHRDFLTIRPNAGRVPPPVTRIVTEFGCLGRFGRRDGLHAQVTHRAQIPGISPTQLPGPALTLEAELLAVALEDILDKGLATEHNPIGEVTHAAAQGLLERKLPAPLKHSIDRLTLLLVCPLFGGISLIFIGVAPISSVALDRQVAIEHLPCNGKR